MGVVLWEWGSHGVPQTNAVAMWEEGETESPLVETQLLETSQ